MSPKTVHEISVEFRRVMHMQTMVEMAWELQKLNLSTEGSQEDLHQRLLRFYLDKSFSNIEPISMFYSSEGQVNFQLIYYKPERIAVSNQGKVILVNMQPEQSSVGKAECEKRKIHFQNPTDGDTKEEKSESMNDKEQTDYQLSCLNLLRAWVLCNPYMKDETPMDFLGNLADLRKFAKMDDEMLLKMLPCVLWPEIKSWYRTKNFNSWQEFELSFLEKYSSKSFDIPKSTDATTENRTAQTLATAETEANKSDCINDEIVDKLSDSQSNQSEKQVGKTDLESSWDCLAKLRRLCSRFTGQKGLAAVTFMDDLNDFRSHAGVSDRVLLDVLPSILDEDTKIWYWAKNFTSWQDFEAGFIACYECIPKKAIRPKSHVTTTVLRPTRFHSNNSTNPNNDLFTVDKNSTNSISIPTVQYPLTMPKPPITNQPNGDSTVLSTLFSSQRPICSISAGASSNDGLPNSRVGLGYDSYFPVLDRLFQ